MNYLELESRPSQGSVSGSPDSRLASEAPAEMATRECQPIEDKTPEPPSPAEPWREEPPRSAPAGGRSFLCLLPCLPVTLAFHDVCRKSPPKNSPSSRGSFSQAVRRATHFGELAFGLLPPSLGLRCSPSVETHGEEVRVSAGLRKDGPRKRGRQLCAREDSLEGNFGARRSRRHG